MSIGITLSQLFSADFELEDFLIPVIVALGVLVGIALRIPVSRGLVLLLMMCGLGYVLGYLQVEKRYIGHYALLEEPEGFIGVVVSDHTERTNHMRYEVQLDRLVYPDTASQTFGKIYLYINKEESSLLRYGDVIAVSKGYFGVSPPKNPEEFDYKHYLELQNIYSHAFVDNADVIVLSNKPPNILLAYAYRLRGYAQGVIQTYIKERRERAIVSALVLGIKDHIDNELKLAYSSAGAIHVLAVSGLHVGIFVWLLNLLLSPLKRHLVGRFVFLLVSLSLIWMYALVTGLSPSVMRAATMFSVVLISEVVNRKSNIYNSLGIAAFVLIILDPFIIYSVGFQLSFIAVFGILMIYPLLYHKVHFHSKVWNYLWSILCVSVAAQIATFPLTLYYFHQFPTYFLISNLVVIPGATFMLCGGLLLLVMGSIFPTITAVLAYIYEWGVCLINDLVFFLQKLPYPLFDWLYMDLFEVILVYLILLLVYQLLISYKYPLLRLVVFLVVVFNGWSIWKDWKLRSEQKLVFYELDGVTAIDVIEGSKATLLVDTFPASKKDEIYYQVNPYRLANGLPKVENNWMKVGESPWGQEVQGITAVCLNDFRMLMVKDLDSYELKRSLKADVVVVESNMSKFDELFQCKMVILGNGMNYYDRKRMTELARHHEILCHSLNDQGYLALDLNALDFPKRQE